MPVMVTRRSNGRASSHLFRYRVGQNLANGYAEWSHAIQGWFNEKSLFTYGNQQANDFLAVGHYTQVSIPKLRPSMMQPGKNDLSLTKSPGKMFEQSFKA